MDKDRNGRKDHSNQDSRDILYEVHPQDDPLRASPNEFEHLSNLPAWRDIEMTLQDRIEILYEDMESVDNMEDLRDLQARISELKSFKKIPYYLRNVALQEQEQEQEEQNK